MFGPGHEHMSYKGVAETQVLELTSKQSYPCDISSKFHTIRNKITPESSTDTQSRVPQLLKVHKRRVTFDELRSARRLSKSDRRPCQTEKAIQLRKYSDGAQVDTAVDVELCVDTVAEVLDGRVAELSSLFEAADICCELWDCVTSDCLFFVV